MKIKITPLLLASIALILYAFWLIIFAKEFAVLIGMILIPIGLVILTLHYAFRKIFKTNIWWQVLTETILLLIVAFSIYRYNTKTFLHVQPGFHGYIIIVYGVDNTTKIRNASLLSPITDIIVPQNGIIFTTNKLSENRENISLVEGSNEKTKLLLPYDVSISWDRLTCGEKYYNLNVIHFDKSLTNWKYDSDSTKRNIMKELACKILSE
jgi:hypothetical protein